MNDDNTLTYGGVEYFAVPAHGRSCKGCAFSPHHTSEPPCNTARCFLVERQDKRRVIYVPLDRFAVLKLQGKA